MSSARERFWSYIERPLTQTGFGMVLAIVGTIVPSKIAMIVAGFVFLFAAHREGWFRNLKWHKALLRFLATSAVITVFLGGVWIGAWGLREHPAVQQAPSQTTATNAQPEVSPILVPQPQPITEGQSAEQPKLKKRRPKAAPALPQPAESSAKEQSATPSVPTQQPTFIVTNPSGSIINQGSTVAAPQTVNNYGPPPAKITAWEQKPARWQEAGGLVPETQLTLTIDHSMEIPAFAVKCDRPCRVRDAVVFGAYNKVNYLTTNDPNISGAVFLSPRPLGAGMQVEYRVRAQDGSLPKILEVSTISPEQLK